MKEELQGKLVEILTSIQAAAGKASDFALAELPDIAQSYIAYGRVLSVVQMFLVVALFVAIAYASHRFVKWMTAADMWEVSPVLAFPLAGEIICVVSFYNVVHSALLVWLAPKVWLLKEIAGMLK